MPPPPCLFRLAKSPVQIGLKLHLYKALADIFRKLFTHFLVSGDGRLCLDHSMMMLSFGQTTICQINNPLRKVSMKTRRNWQSHGCRRGPWIPQAIAKLNNGTSGLMKFKGSSMTATRKSSVKNNDEMIKSSVKNNGHSFLQR